MPLHSHHIFLFPFKWSFIAQRTKGKPSSFIERTDLKAVSKLMNHQDPQKNLWQPFKFNFGGDAKRYNEWIYFYENVRESLFDIHDNEHLLNEYNKPLLLQYDIQKEGMTYAINFKDKDKSGHYVLDLEQITLNFYTTGVGILAFHINNTTVSDPNDILYINEYGRRFYPQFLSNPNLEKNKKANTEEEKEHYLSSVHGAFLAQQITIKVDDTHLFSEDFTSLRASAKWEDAATQHWLPQFIGGILGNNFISHKQAIKIIQSDVIHLTPLIDDRMFTMCHLINDAQIDSVLPHKMQELSSIARSIYPYQKDDFWYKFIFIDKKDPSLNNDDLKATLLEKHSYTRWIGDEQLYGMSRYSFMLLTSKSKSYMLSNFQSMYFQIVVLCLAQRTSVLRFSEEATKVQLGRKMDEIESVYHKYIEFINKIFFREVTAQEQGIEIYDKLQEIMRTEKHVKELDTEIQELHNYMSLKEDEKRNRKLDMLTIIGFIFLPASLLLSFLGMNYFGNGALQTNVKWLFNPEYNDPSVNSVRWALFSVTIAILFSLGVWLFVRGTFKNWFSQEKK